MTRSADLGLVLSGLRACASMLDPIVEQLPDEQLGQVYDEAQKIVRMCSEAWWAEQRPSS